MKKAFTLILFFCLLESVKAQITFTSANAPVAYWTQRIVKDTLPLPSVSYGNKGANQVYDFSNLVLFKNDTIEYRTPTNTQLTNVPTADDAITNDGVSFLFTKTTSSQYTLEGFEGNLSGSTVAASYSAPPKIYQFPTVYGGNFSGTADLQKTVPGSQVGQPSVSDVRLTTHTVYTDTVDGWGKVVTPVGSYKCLRIKRKEITTTTTEYRIFSFSQWTNIPGSPSTRTTVRYSYLTKETKGSAVTFEYDSVDNLLSVSYSLIPPTAPVANFGYTAGAAGSVSFTDSSDFYPTTWAWTFGDGGTSTQQNPSHTYAANGTYTVCLTATNAGGSSTQVCKQVVVNNIVIAPVADFNWSNVSGGLVNFTDVSTNGPTTWAWTFGDAATSTQQNPSHVYAANNTYNVCLTASNTAGSNQRCKNVVVSLVSAGNNAPVALNDTASVLQPFGVTRNVGLNDVDPNGDNFCITLVYGSPHFAEAGIGNCTSITYTPDSSFIGSDSCYYIICDNGSPVKCDTGKFVVNSLYNPAVYPVAVNDVATALQPDGITANVGANDTDPSGAFCITSIYGGGTAFAISGCSNIVYTPDSTFTGNDTVWYVICDNSQTTWCDTALLIVTSNANPALLPVADFTWQEENCNGVIITNTSADFASAIVSFHPLNYVGTDSVYSIFTSLRYYGSAPLLFNKQIQTCLTATNQFGSATKCDTVTFSCSDGIVDITLSNIHLYPNPTGNNITVDMSQNNEEASRNYAAIEIYNTFGQKVRVVNDKTSRVVTISVADLIEGMYMATLSDAKGGRRNLGRFVVSH